MKNITHSLDTVTITVKSVERGDSDLDQGSLTLTAQSGEQLVILESEIEAWLHRGIHNQPEPAVASALQRIARAAEEFLKPATLANTKLRRQAELREAVAELHQLQGRGNATGETAEGDSGALPPE